MVTRPDYTTARQREGYSWQVGATVDALATLMGVAMREVYLDPAVGIEVYRRGRPMLRDMFGPDVSLPAPSTPGISYGHANTIGAELIFPDGGEVGHTHPYESLAQGIEALATPVEFASAGMAPFYLDYQRQLAEAFGDENVGLGFGKEGPITTAYAMRGQDFFMDIFDDPSGAHELLRLLTDSIVGFHGFRAQACGQPPVSPTSGGMVDDMASMIPPHMFEAFVLPYWEQYYSGITTGRRGAHVEDLRPEQLPFLEAIGLEHYDPSISARLNPRIITAQCRVPYIWRLGAFHLPNMTPQDVADFVFQAVADGANGVHTHIEAAMVNDTAVEKIHAFIQATKQVERMLDDGATREDVGQCVSDDGRDKFWDNWWS